MCALRRLLHIRHALSPSHTGIAEFSTVQWVADSVRNCCRSGPIPPEHIVVTPNTPAMHTMAAQLTEDNEDFAARGRYHQSEVVRGETFEQQPYDRDDDGS